MVLSIAFISDKCPRKKWKYFYVINSYDEIYLERTQVSDEKAVRRIAEFTDMLAMKKIHPSMINICRSRYSGFTPEDQWAFLEEELVSRLRSLYNVRLIEKDEIFSTVKESCI